MYEWYESSETDILRDRFQSNRLALNVWPLRVVATATISQTSFIPPIADIAVTAISPDWTSAKVGQMVVIRSTSTTAELMTGVVRKTLTSGFLYVDAKVSGDAGRNVKEQVYLETGASVTIYDYMPLWTLFSAIRNGTFYKSFDRAYTNEGTQPAPQCNLGTWRQAYVNPETNTARLKFWAEGVDIIPQGSGTFQYGALPDGATLVAGALDTHYALIDFEPGFYIISCTFTNGNGKAHTAYRPVWINTEGGAHDALSERGVTEIVSDRHEYKARDMSFRLHGEFSTTEIPDGGAFHFSEQRSYGEAQLPVPQGNEAVGVTLLDVRDFVGFAASTRRAYVGDHPQIDLELKGVGSILQEIACAPQAFIESAAPANWAEFLKGYGTAQNFIWYILHYHCPNALALFDFIPFSDEGYGIVRRGQQSTSAQSIGQMADEVSAQLGGYFGSASNGTIYVRRNPSSEEPAWRDYWVTSRLIVTDDDVIDEIGVTENWRPAIGQLTCDGWSVSYSTGETTALRSMWGKSAQAQGSSKQNGPVFMVRDQHDLNRKTGQQAAIENNAVSEIRVKVNPSLDVFDPIRDLSEWFIQMNVGAEYDPRGVGFEGEYTVKAVERNWRRNDFGLVKELSLVLTPITTGLPGETVPIPTENMQADPSWYWIITYPEPSVYFDVPYPYGNYDPDAAPLFPTKIIATSYGASSLYGSDYHPKVFRGTIDITRRTINWQDVSNGLPSGSTQAAVTGYAVDPYNPQRKFLMTQNGLYMCSNIWATSPNWSHRSSYDQVANSRYTTLSARYALHTLRISGNRRGYMIARVGKTRYVTYSTNYGATWIESDIDSGTWPLEDSALSTIDMWDFMEISQHNGPNVGWVYALRNISSTGLPIPPNSSPQSGITSIEIWKSTNWGRAWSYKTTVVLPSYSYGYLNDIRYAHLYIPHTRRDGSYNINDSDKELYLIQPGSGALYNYLYPYTSPSIMLSDDDGNTWSGVFTGDLTFEPWAMWDRGMYMFPHDANIGYTILTEKVSSPSATSMRVARTVDAWASGAVYDPTGLLPDGYSSYGDPGWKVVGFTLNPNVICAYIDGSAPGAPGGRHFGISVDGGQTFFGDYPDDWLDPGDAEDTMRFVEFDMTDFIPPT